MAAIAISNVGTTYNAYRKYKSTGVLISMLSSSEFCKTSESLCESYSFQVL